jgi:hypothetical protein
VTRRNCVKAIIETFLDADYAEEHGLPPIEPEFCAWIPGEAAASLRSALSALIHVDPR